MAKRERTGTAPRRIVAVGLFAGLSLGLSMGLSAQADEADRMSGFTLDRPIPVEAEAQTPRLTGDVQGPILGFTLEMDRVKQERPLAFLPASEGTVGSIGVEWRVSPSITFNTSLDRRLLESRDLQRPGAFLDSVSGRIDYAVTERFSVTARGTLFGFLEDETPETSFSRLDAAPDEAGFAAKYRFLPGLSGSVEYSYRDVLPASDGEEPETDQTVVFRLNGRF